MTHIGELVLTAQQRVPQYVGCSEEQALTYACEDVVVDVLGSRVMSLAELREWLVNVCEQEDVDAPILASLHGNSRVVGSADITNNIVCVRRDTPTVAVVLHELAHVVSRSEVHDATFRNCVVDLWRRHMSVEHAALIHQLFMRSALTIDSWS